MFTARSRSIESSLAVVPGTPTFRRGEYGSPTTLLPSENSDGTGLQKTNPASIPVRSLVKQYRAPGKGNLSILSKLNFAHWLRSVPTESADPFFAMQKKKKR